MATLPQGLGFTGAREQGETQEQFLQRVRKGDRAGLAIVAGGTIHGISDPESVYSQYGEDFLKTLGPVEATGRSGGNMPLAQLLTFGKSAQGAFDTYYPGGPAAPAAPAPAVQLPPAPQNGAPASVPAQGGTKQQATVFNPLTGARKVVTIGDPNAFAGGFVLETPTDSYAIRKTKGTAGAGTNTGAGATGGTPAANDLNAAADAAAAEANKKAEEILNELGNKDVSVRDSATILKDVEAKLFPEKPPEAPSLVNTYAAKKAELGIDPLETELAGIDSDIESINANLLVEAEKAGERLVSMSEISRSKGKLQKEADQRIALLNVKRSGVARLLGNKLDTLNTIMNLTGQDYNNAESKYTNEFNRNVQIFNAVKNIEQDEKNDAEKAKDDARSNAQIAINTITASGLSYSELSDTEKLNLSKLGLQAGMGADFFATVLKVSSGKDILTTVTSADDTQATIIYKDGTTKKVMTGLPPKQGGGKSVSEQKQEQMDADRQTIMGDVGKITGNDRKVDPKKMSALRQDVALNNPELLTWFDNAYQPKDMLNSETYPLAVEKNQWTNPND